MEDGMRIGGGWRRMSGGWMGDEVRMAEDG